MENFTNPNRNFFEAGQGGNPLGTSPIGSTPVNTTIDANTLGQAQPLNLPTAPVDTTNYGGIIQSIPSLQDITQQMQGTSQTERTQQSLSERLLGSLSRLGGRSEAQLKAEQQVGLPQFQTQLTDVNNQLQALQKEALAIPLQLQQDVQGRGVTTGGLAPIQTGQLRQNAIKSLTLSAIGQTLQGNIANAQAQADRAVALEFAPLEAEVETLKQAYMMNKDFLEREDKKRADALNFQIQERTRLLNNEKEEKKYVSDLMLKAAQYGASPDVLQKMFNSTPEGAIALGSQYLGAEFKQQAEQLAFENNIRTREISLKESAFLLDRRRSLLELASNGDSNAINELGYDPRNIPLSAEELRSYEEQKINIEKDIQDIKDALDNKRGLNASTGLIRGGLSTIGGGLMLGGAGAGAGSVFGPVGTVAGGISGFTAGAANTAQKRNSFMGTARYVVNNLRLNKVGELADMGIKLNPISEAELQLMGEASKRLAALGDYNDKGQLVGFTGTAEEVEREMRSVLSHYERALGEINKKTLLTIDDINEIKQTK